MSDDLVKKMNETAITPELLGAVSEMHLALPANEATDMASCVGHIFGPVMSASSPNYGDVILHLCDRNSLADPCLLRAVVHHIGAVL